MQDYSDSLLCPDDRGPRFPHQWPKPVREERRLLQAGLARAVSRPDYSNRLPQWNDGDRKLFLKFPALAGGDALLAHTAPDRDRASLGYEGKWQHRDDRGLVLFRKSPMHA